MKKYVVIKVLLYIFFIIGVVWGMIFVNNNSSIIYKVFFTISISGLVGIGTNTIAIKMLFRPLEKTNLLRR